MQSTRNYREISDLWKWLAMSLGIFLLSGIVVWLAWANQLVVRKEVVEMMATQVPYASDKPMLLDRLKMIEQKIDELTKDNNQIKLSLVRVETKQDQMLQDLRDRK